MLRKLITIFACLLAFVTMTAAQKQAIPAKTPVKTNQRPAPPKAAPVIPFEKATVEEMSKQCVTLETESGNISLEMFPESAPQTVRNFLNLTASGFFDTTTFSRVVPGFIIQGGDLATRSKVTAEFSNRAQQTVPDEPSQIKHERGIISMARTAEPNSAGTNFFILAGDAPHLDGTFAAFGSVTSGMEIVDAINKMPVENEKPAKPVHINKATAAPCQ